MTPISTQIGTLTVLVPPVLFLLGLTFTVVIDPYFRRDHRRILLIIAALCLTLIAQNYWDYALTVGPPRQTLRTIVSIYGYCVRPVILILFLYIVQPEGKRWYWWLLAGLNAAVYFTALFCSVSFWIDQWNYYHSGPLAPSCLVTSVILLISLSIRTYRGRGAPGKWSIWIPTFVIVLIVASVSLDYRVSEGQMPISFLTIAIVFGSVFYYIWLHLQFVRAHERDLMASQRIQLMLSQIKPHFLFNALGAIEALCDSDPRAAKHATVEFAQYLRGNVNSLSEEGVIPFEKELEHTRLYLDLEQIRFEDALKVEYDIACSDFPIPTLTLEPIVENAVRHGVRGNANGRGTVTLAARDCGDHYEVRVTDDGPGFDPDALSGDMSHVGLRNVRERLKTVCGGSLTIESAARRGTTVTIRLPKED